MQKSGVASGRSFESLESAFTLFRFRSFNPMVTPPPTSDPDTRISQRGVKMQGNAPRIRLENDTCYLFHWRPWVFVNCKLEFGGPGGESDADLTMPHPPCNQLHTVKAPSLVGMAPVFNAFKVYSFMPARVFFLNEYRSGQTAFPAIKDWFRGSKQDMLVSSIASRAILLQHTHWKQNAFRRCQCSSAVSFPCIDYCFVPRQLWPAEAFSLR